MKLRDQFKTEFSINTSGESGRFAYKCVEIADDFAINFAEWCDNKASQISPGEWTNFLPNAKNCLTSKELLEIYKIEKGL